MCTRTIRAYTHSTICTNESGERNRNGRPVVIIHYIPSQSNYCSHTYQPAGPNTWPHDNVGSVIKEQSSLSVMMWRFRHISNVMLLKVADVLFYAEFALVELLKLWSCRHFFYVMMWGFILEIKLYTTRLEGNYFNTNDNCVDNDDKSSDCFKRQNLLRKVLRFF